MINFLDEWHTCYLCAVGENVTDAHCKKKKKYLHEPLLEFTLSFEELYLGDLITSILEVSWYPLWVRSLKCSDLSYLNKRLICRFSSFCLQNPLTVAPEWKARGSQMLVAVLANKITLNPIWLHPVRLECKHC